MDTRSKTKVKSLTKKSRKIFRRAIISGDRETFEQFLHKRDIDIYANICYGKSALLYIAENGHFEFLKALVDANKIQNINQCDKDRCSPLALAARNGHTECVRCLIDTGLADANLRDRWSYTALMHMVATNRVECLKYLVDANKVGNINQKCDADERTALMMATEKGYTEHVTGLTENKLTDANLCDRNGYTAPMHVVENDHDECLKHLVDANKVGNINQECDGCQQTAVVMMKGDDEHTDCVRRLIDTRLCDVNHSDWGGNTALMIGANNDHYECVKYLTMIEGIAVNCDNMYGQTALILASVKGNFKCIESLIGRADIDVNHHDRYENTALILAAEHGHTKCVSLLLTNGMLELNARNKKGCTALMLAALKGHTQCVKLLLSHDKVDVNMCDHKGCTALMLAMRKNRYKCARCLIFNKNVNVWERDNNGKTAFMIDTGMSRGYCLDWLFEITVIGQVDHDTECNQKESRFATVFSLPYKDGSVRYCPGIMWKRPYIYGSNQEGKSVLKLVIRNGLPQCVVCFLLAGLDVSLAENISCSHTLLNKRELPDFYHYGQTSLIAAVQIGYFNSLEYFLQFERIRIHILVILLREEFCATGTISLSFYKKLCSLIQNHRDVDRFLCMMCSDDKIVVCVDYLLSAFICQTNSYCESALSLAISLSDPNPFRILLEHVSERNMLINHIEAFCKENPFTTFYFHSVLELLKFDIFHWNWFPKCKWNERKALTRELVIRGFAPGCFEWQDKQSSPLHFALMTGDDGLVRYLVANLFLTSHDLHHVQQDTEIREYVRRIGAEDLQQLYLEIGMPWRLEIQSLLTLCNWLRNNRNKNGMENVQHLLPEIFRSRLPFINPFRLICQRQWKKIDLDFLNQRLSVTLSDVNLFQGECCNGGCLMFEEDVVTSDEEDVATSYEDDSDFFYSESSLSDYMHWDYHSSD